MSNLHSSLNGSASNLPDGSGRSFAASYSGQSGAPSPSFHHSGNLQGLHNIHGSYNVGNMQGTLSSRNSSMNSIPSAGGVQQPNGSFSNGRFASNNLPVALSQLSHGSSHGHSGIPNRGGINVVGNPGFSNNASGVGGSIPGILSTSAGLSNRNSVPGMGISQMLGNGGPRITNSMGNMVGGGNLGRNISSAGLSIPGLSSRLNLGANSGSGLNVQGQNRMLGGVVPQGSQVMSMLGNSYHNGGGGPLSQNLVQSVNNMMLGDHSNDSSLFDINNDFPQLTSRPGSAGGTQGQLGSLRKQGLGVPIIQQNQEFSIQNEDFPALPVYKGGGSDYPMDLHQKEQLHDNMSMMHSQNFSMGRSGGFNLGGTYPSHRQQQQQPHHTSSTGGMQGLGLRPLNSPNTVSCNNYDQLIQHYQQHQNQSQFPGQQLPSINQFRDSEMKPTQSEADPFCLLGLLDVLNRSNPGLTSLALGIDLTTLGLDLNSSGNLYKTFASPWTNEPAKTDVEFTVPNCYYATLPPPLTRASFKRFSFELLFYIFYSMPKDEAQLYAADELYERRWFYNKELRLWFFRVGEPLVKSGSHERGTYECLDPNSLKTVRKEHLLVNYEHMLKRPSLVQQH
ncbi:unnamed protein product [Cochlearia groenlandica]